MNNFSRLKYTKPTDEKLFIKVAQRFFPELNAKDDGYYNGDNYIGPDPQAIIKELADLTQNLTSTGKFSTYPEYLSKLSKRRKNDRTLARFTKEFKREYGTPVISKAKTKASIREEVVTEKDISTETVIEEFYESGALKKRTTKKKTIGERTRTRDATVTHVKKTYGDYLDSKQREGEDRITKIGDAVVQRYKNELAELCRHRKMDESEMVRLSRSFCHYDCELTEEDHFSYSKAIRIENKTKKNLPSLTRQLLDYRHLSYIDFFKEIKDLIPLKSVTRHEELYVHLSIIGEFIARFSTDKGYEYSRLKRLCFIEQFPPELESYVKTYK